MGHSYCIEYHNRDLPYLHLLLFLHKDNHFPDLLTIEKSVGEADLELLSIIIAAMVHGLRCYENLDCLSMSHWAGETLECSKAFPKAVYLEITMQANSFL
jgi:hypothetical protein